MNKISSNQIVIGCFCAIGCEVCYGFSYIFTKQATQIASGIALMGWRFLIGFLAMALMVCTGLVKVEWKGKDLRRLIPVMVFCPVLYFTGETMGIAHTTASESGIFLACIPMVSILASTVILRKHPTRIQVTGILITLTGVLITTLAAGIGSSLSLIGYIFLIVAVLAYSLYTVYVDKASAFTGTELTFAMLAAGAFVFVLLAAAEGVIKGNATEVLLLPFRERVFLRAVLYQGIICSILAFFLSNGAILRIGVNRTASFVGISTVVSILAGVLMLGERFVLWQGIGAAVIIAGVIIANSNAKNAA